MSMSFMLASLRVLHIDIPGAPAVASRLSSRRPTNDLSAPLTLGNSYRLALVRRLFFGERKAVLGARRQRR